MNIFQQDPADKVIFATVTHRLTNTLYSMTDARGRKFSAESGSTYRVGQSVSLKSGVIIGKAKVPKEVKHFNV